MTSLNSLPIPIKIDNINDQNIDEILQRLKQLTRDEKYRIYGIWSCQSRECSHEWESLYTPGRFRDYLDKTERHSFRRKCWSCGNKVQFSSIQLYEQQTIIKESNITQIVRQLKSTSNNNYLVYGHWVCRNWKCRHNPKCQDKSKCRDKWQYQHRWQCQHNPRCKKGEQCRKRMCKCHVKYGRRRQDQQNRAYNSKQRPLEHERHCQSKWIKQNEWKCKHNPECKTERECQREWKCQHEWQNEYTQEKIKGYQKNDSRQQCEECKEMSTISSFRLYTQQPKDTNETPTIEIICHLEWNNHYRVFGKWNCCGCTESWPSSFTWISLRKFVDKISGESLNQVDYYMQNCKVCQSSENKLLEYTPLKQGESKKPHTRGSCIRCLYYDTCRDTQI
ncbi:hypothetical protein C1645_788340 [Glomus cerebriforme]|uniref:3CxxC-type domain-containing protein n=1 Tax=Glomus cerebriforme TaxID=658196 RepID=A0A397SCI6_9GLOM|nr:hypothetical protein C1645_788340 [Glomus cerebriforme]